MSMPFAEAIASSAKRMRGYSERVTKDLTDSNFGRLPRWGMQGDVIKCNHPAWVFGHLAVYPARILNALGVKHHADAPANFESLFKDGTPCHDDITGTIYPPMKTVMAAYFKAIDAVIEATGKLSDADLAKPVADENMKKHFPTNGELLIFMLNNHIALHVGQISTWRRTMGLPPA